MKVFLFFCGETHYAFAAKTKELAVSEFHDQTGEECALCEEIPESKWDKKNIKMWVDNDFETKPYKESIRDLIHGEEPQFIYSNDMSFLS